MESNDSKKYLLLGDMLELGKHSIWQHKLMSNVINKTKIEDSFKSKIIDYFKDNLIYEENLNYHILEAKSNIVGFFLYNNTKYYNKKEKQLKDLDNVIDDYDFYIYKNDTFYNISNMVDGELIKGSIKNNFLKVKDTTPLLKTSTLP